MYRPSAQRSRAEIEEPVERGAYMAAAANRFMIVRKDLETLVSQYGCDPEKIILSVIGPVIGSHSGPGTVALFFRGRDRG